MFVRIKPHLPVSSYNEFWKDRGLYEVDDAKAEWCRTRRINDLNPQAELVFDVYATKTEADAVYAGEQKLVAPAGTPDAPVRLPGAPSVPSADGTPPPDGPPDGAGVADETTGGRKLRR